MRTHTLVLVLLLVATAHADPFRVGVNYPWYVEDGRPMTLFGELTEARRTAVRGHLAGMQAAGTTVLRVWTLAHAAGFPRRVDGRFEPLAARFVEDLRWFVREAHAHGIRVEPSLWDFHLNREHGDWIANLEIGRELGRTVVEPLVRALAGEPGLGAWDVLNEPEWIMDRPPVATQSGLLAKLGSLPRRIALGGAGLGPDVGVKHPAEHVKAWVATQVAAVHAGGGRATVGAASPLTVAFWKGLALDEYQVHFYPLPGADLLGNAAFAELPSVASLGLDRPCTLGEYPPNVPRTDISKLLDSFRKKGYAGAYAWSFFGAGTPEDRGHEFSWHARATEIGRWVAGAPAGEGAGPAQREARAAIGLLGVVGAP